MKIAIAGGCFTSQHNIPFEGLYHQTLKRALAENGIHAEIQAIRYERISKSLEKIVKLKKEYDFDLLVFHLRTEQMARMSKLYYKHLDENGALKHALNLPYLRRTFYPEQFDILSQRRFSVQGNNNHEGKIRAWLRNVNYRIGSLAGNKRYALKLLEKSVLEIQAFAVQHNIRFVLAGPVARPFCAFEDKLSRQISQKFGRISEKKSMHYLDLRDKVSARNKAMFFENGIHVSQQGHDAIAEMMRESLLKTGN